jgi:hypothetical protein
MWKTQTDLIELEHPGGGREEPAVLTSNAAFDDAGANFAGGTLADDVVDFFKAFDITQFIKNHRGEKLVVLLPPKKERNAVVKSLHGDRVSIINNGLYHVVPFSHFSAATKSCAEHYKTWDESKLIRMAAMNGQYIDYMCGLGHTEPGHLWMGDFAETIQGPVEKNAKMNPVDMPPGYPSMLYVVRLKRFLMPPPRTLVVTANVSATDHQYEPIIFADSGYIWSTKEVMEFRENGRGAFVGKKTTMGAERPPVMFISSELWRVADQMLKEGRFKPRDPANYPCCDISYQIVSYRNLEATFNEVPELVAIANRLLKN